MNLYATLALSLALSMDAFAVSVCKGATLFNPSLREAIRTGLIFGIIEAITPIIGWCLGLLASQYVIKLNHWIAFGLLFILGSQMIYQSYHRAKNNNKSPLIHYHNSFTLITTAIATSLDAMAIGVSLAFLQINIIHTAMTIALMAMIMATLGILLGRYIGPLLGKTAEMMGGVTLIMIGFSIIYQHI
ncbi:manganese efflux pump MntP [Arsenophonus nasoniae]|uniref:Putative manganese efflux pump MntP n=1 Tax=Arsenophonus nasoniae TaxID=638 RepID=A0AA95JZA6_9GAMM|nr:manganese efflux pump MntP [Arsenophonus nasoniae]WGL94109.1 manganese efflux pump MntP [Arsenophonus nasoniae]